MQAYHIETLEQSKFEGIFSSEGYFLDSIFIPEIGALAGYFRSNRYEGTRYNFSRDDLAKEKASKIIGVVGDATGRAVDEITLEPEIAQKILESKPGKIQIVRPFNGETKVLVDLLSGKCVGKPSFFRLIAARLCDDIPGIFVLH